MTFKIRQGHRRNKSHSWQHNNQSFSTTLKTTYTVYVLQTERNFKIEENSFVHLSTEAILIERSLLIFCAKKLSTTSTQILPTQNHNYAHWQKSKQSTRHQHSKQVETACNNELWTQVLQQQR